MKDKILEFFKKPTAKSVSYYNQIKRPKNDKNNPFIKNNGVINFVLDQSIKGASKKEGGKLKLI